MSKKHRSFFAFVKKVRNSPAAHEENHRTLVTLTAFIIGKQASITAAAYTAGFTGTKTEKKITVTIATGTKQKPLYYSLLASPRPKCFTCHKNCISDTTGSRTEHNCCLLKPTNAALLEKE